MKVVFESAILDSAGSVATGFAAPSNVEIWLELPEMGALARATPTDVDENVAIQPGFVNADKLEVYAERVRPSSPTAY